MTNNGFEMLDPSAANVRNGSLFRLLNDEDVVSLAKMMRHSLPVRGFRARVHDARSPLLVPRTIPSLQRSHLLERKQDHSEWIPNEQPKKKKTPNLFHEILAL